MAKGGWKGQEAKKKWQLSWLPNEEGGGWHWQPEKGWGKKKNKTENGEKREAAQAAAVKEKRRWKGWSWLGCPKRAEEKYEKKRKQKRK